LDTNSSGVRVSMLSACTPPSIFSSSSSNRYTSWCRCTSRLPSNSDDTTSTRKWVSASAAPEGLPLCPACLCDSLTIVRVVGLSAASSFLFVFLCVVGGKEEGGGRQADESTKSKCCR
jgi:hypothetical protein